jgi:hypothetical protein
MPEAKPSCASSIPPFGLHSFYTNTNAFLFQVAPNWVKTHPRWQPRIGLWPGPIWAGYRLNGSLKTGFTTNRFHSVSGYLENGPKPV